MRFRLNHSLHVRRLIARSCVAPLDNKRLTLPRLEFPACLLGARLLSKLASVIGSSPPCFSLCCGWIKGKGRWKQFVENRVLEIRRLTDVENWSHISGLEYPADLVSRGSTLNRLLSSAIWKCGPTWLSADSSSCPVGASDAFDPCVEEMAEPANVMQVHICDSAQQNLWKVEDFSSLTHLLAVVVWVRRFIFNSKNPNLRKTGDLCFFKLKEAKRICIERD